MPTKALCLAYNESTASKTPFAVILLANTALPQSSLAMTGDTFYYQGHVHLLH